MSRPRLIFVSGLPATGKSTLTAYLSKELGMLAFSKDDFKVALADSLGFTDHESTRPFGKASFALLFLVARRCLENGISIIIDANFSLGEETKDFIKYLEENQIETREILCHADGELIVRRFKERKRHPVHHTLDPELLEEYIQTTLISGKDVPLNAGKLLEVDTTDPSAIDYESIISFAKGKWPTDRECHSEGYNLRDDRKAARFQISEQSHNPEGNTGPGPRRPPFSLGGSS